MSAEGAVGSFLRRLAVSAVLIITVLGLPAGLAWLLGGSSAAAGAAIGGLFGLLLALRTGWLRALLAAPVMLATIVVGTATADSVWWVLLIAGIGAATGILTIWGAAPSGAMVGIIASLTQGSSGSDGVGTAVVAAGLAIAFAAMLARRLGTPAVVADPPVSPGTAWPVAVMLTLIAGAAGVGAQVSSTSFSYWLPMLVFILVMPVPGVRFSQAARDRLVGTAAGALVGLLLAGVGAPAGPRVIGGMLLLLLVLAVPEPRWLNAALSTTMIVLVLDPSGVGATAAGVRLAFTVEAVLLLGVGALVLTALGWRPQLLAAESAVVTRAIAAG